MGAKGYGGDGKFTLSFLAIGFCDQKLVIECGANSIRALHKLSKDSLKNLSLSLTSKNDRMNLPSPPYPWYASDVRSKVLPRYA